MKLNTTIGNVGITLDTSRIEGNLREAQKKLNEQIVADCTPLVPKGASGGLRKADYPQTVYGGEIMWDKPYAHFQYVDFVRTDENGRVVVGKDEKKPILTDRPLHYSEPTAQSEWFEKAKEQHGADWVKLVKETVGRG